MKLKHFDHDGRARFITFCTHKRKPLLTNNKFRQIIVRVIAEIRDKEKFRLLGYVIMPEHIHLVIIPKIDSKVGEIIGAIKRRSSEEIHRLILKDGHPVPSDLRVKRNGVSRIVFWQRRCYDHNCRTEASLGEKIRYCHNNPVKRGLVSSPGRWRWSSFRRYQGESDVELEIDISG